MYWNEMFIECLVTERLAEARSAAAERQLARQIPGHTCARAALGAHLVRLGHWVAGAGAAPLPEGAGR